jgi:hypothetical protein
MVPDRTCRARVSKRVVWWNASEALSINHQNCTVPQFLFLPFACPPL